MATVRTFQDLILALQQYWALQGCAVLQPYDMEVGAGTFHTATSVSYTHVRILIGYNITINFKWY